MGILGKVFGTVVKGMGHIQVDPGERRRMVNLGRRMCGQKALKDEYRRIDVDEQVEIHEHELWDERGEIVGGVVTGRSRRGGGSVHAYSTYVGCPFCGVVNGVPIYANRVDAHRPDGPVGGIIRRCKEIEQHCTSCGRPFHVKAI